MSSGTTIVVVCNNFIFSRLIFETFFFSSQSLDFVAELDCFHFFLRFMSTSSASQSA